MAVSIRATTVHHARAGKNETSFARGRIAPRGPAAAAILLALALWTAAAAAEPGRCQVLDDLTRTAGSVADAVQTPSAATDWKTVTRAADELDRLGAEATRLFGEGSPVTRALRKIRAQTRAALLLTSAGALDQARAILDSPQYGEMVRYLGGIDASRSCAGEGAGGAPEPAPPLTDGDRTGDRFAEAPGTRAAGLPRQVDGAGTDDTSRPLILLQGLAVAALGLLGLYAVTARCRAAEPEDGSDFASLRAFERFDIDLPCFVDFGEGELLGTRCRDVSQSGLAIVSSQRYRHGRAAILHVASVAIPCSVAWSGRRTTGFKFDETLEERALARILKENESAEPVRPAAELPGDPDRAGQPA